LQLSAAWQTFVCSYRRLDKQTRWNSPFRPVCMPFKTKECLTVVSTTITAILTESLFDSSVESRNEWLGARGMQVTFLGKVFFPSKVPEFLHVLLNLVEKHSPVSFFDWNALVRLCCVHCACFDVLSSFFSGTKCKPAQKYNWKNSGTFEGKKIYPKKSLYLIRPTCTKPFKCWAEFCFQFLPVKHFSNCWISNETIQSQSFWQSCNISLLNEVCA